MQISFFATEADELAVWGMALAIPGLRVLERSTREPRELREFTTPEDIRAAQANFPPLIELCLSTSVSPEIDVEYDSLGEVKSRTVSRPSSIGFHRHNPVSGCLNHCNFYATNRSSFGAGEPLSDDLEELIKAKARTFRKLKREIEKAAPAKAGIIPILPDAFGKLKSGELNLWGNGEPISISSPVIVVKGAD